MPPPPPPANNAHDEDVERVRLKVLGWRDRALDVWEELYLRIERFLPDGWLVQAVAGALVLVVVTVFFAVDGRLHWWLGLLLTVGIAGGSAAAGWFASRVEPPEEDTSERDADLAALIAAYAQGVGDDDAESAAAMDDTVDLDPGNRDARFGAFLRGIWWLHAPWVVVYTLSVVMPAIAVLPIGKTTQQVAIGCTVMPALVATTMLSWAVWSRSVVRGAVRAGVRPARVLTGPIAAVGMTVLTISAVWGLVGASPWGGPSQPEAAEVENAGEADEDARSDTRRFDDEADD